MTTIARCFTIDQALIIKSVLDGCGVEAFVPDELTVQTQSALLTGSMNSIRVQVKDEDAATARAILEQNDLPAEG